MVELQVWNPNNTNVPNLFAVCVIQKSPTELTQLWRQMGHAAMWRKLLQCTRKTLAIAQWKTGTRLLNLLVVSQLIMKILHFGLFLLSLFFFNIFYFLLFFFNFQFSMASNLKYTKTHDNEQPVSIKRQLVLLGKLLTRAVERLCLCFQTSGKT